MAEVELTKPDEVRTVSTTRDVIKLVYQDAKRLGYKMSVESKCHGVSNITSNDSLIFRFVWLILFLGSSGACGYFIFHSMADYFAYDVVSSSRIVTEVPMMFPTVSICSANPITNNVSLAYVDQIIANGDDPSNFDLINSYNLARYLISSSINMPTNNRSVLQSYGLSIDQMILSSMFDLSPTVITDEYR